MAGLVRPGNADDGAWTARAEAAFRIAKAALRAAPRACVEDIAFIGNAGAIYEWSPCNMIDLDCFLFSGALDATLGHWLDGLRRRLCDELDRHGVDFALRIVEGPIKPSLARLARPILMAHLGVFTEESYLRAPALKRWAWRKYACERDIGRLARLAPERPSLAELVDGAKGVAERTRAIREGKVRMTEWLLPDLRTRDFEIARDDVAFQECCFAYAANCARNHARALGYREPDRLGNEDYFAWYCATFGESASLLRLMEMKAGCRMSGFDRSTEEVRRLALDFLEGLLERLTCHTMVVAERRA